MKRPQLVSAGSLKRMIETALDSWERCDFKQCFEMLERVSRLDPANLSIMLQLGRLHGLRYNYTAAERCFEKALRFASNKTETSAIIAQLSVDIGSFEMAGDYFRRAVEQKDALPETFARLAELYERLHRTEDATRLVDQALQLDDSCDLARLTRAKLYRRAGRLEEAEQLLRRFSTADQNLKVRGHYELGANLDLQGRYDEAMLAFLEAKALLRPAAPPLLAQFKSMLDYLKQMQNDVSAGMLQSWFDSGQELLKPPRRLALIGGHPRSGTTLLEQVLDSHPDIVSANEATVFRDDAYIPLLRKLPPMPMLSALEKTPINTLRQLRINYFRSMESCLRSPIGNRLLIDKNPDITVLIPALVRIFPEMKLLVAIRDPRDVCLSSFMLAHVPVSLGSVSSLDLEGTVETYTLVMGIWKTMSSLIKNPWIEVRYEDMVDDLAAVARRTLDFLDVPWDERVLGFDETARQKGLLRSHNYADVTKPVYKRALGRWRNYRKYLEPHLEKLEPFVKAFGYE